MKNTGNHFSILYRIRSFYFAFRGIRLAFRSEHNLWIHALAALVAVTLGFLLRINRAEWLIVVVVIAVVFASELFNSALETLVDLCSPDFSEKAGKIKDISAGAVLMAAAGALVAGLIIFLPRLIDYFTGLFVQ